MPPELRRRVWEMAVHTDKTPKLHFYSLFNTDDDGRRQSNLQRLMDACPTPWNKKPVQRYRISGIKKAVMPPFLRSRPREFAWTEANRFLHLWDAGMLTACRESRSAYLAAKDPPREGGYLVKARHQGEDVYLEVSVELDIVCFRFSPEDMEASVSLDWGGLLSRLPFFRLPQMPDMNLAFEFDNSWNADIAGLSLESASKYLAEASPRGIVMRAHWDWHMGRIPRWTRIWLIDRSSRLPDNYQLGGPIDCVHRPDQLYGRAHSSWPEKHHTFVDGANKYVESYSWNGSKLMFIYSDAYTISPVLQFIRTVKYSCLPAWADPNAPYNRNFPCICECLFRVLRQLPS
jgi:hypothetical protein